MKKKVLLLAVSCKTGGLCPGGIDLDNPKNGYVLSKTTDVLVQCKA